MNLGVDQFGYSLYCYALLSGLKIQKITEEYGVRVILREKRMAANVEDITIEYEEDGIMVIKELDKEILSKGAWATVLFRYRQWDKRKQEYGEDCYAIRRYQKVHDEDMPKSKFNISSKLQAEKIVEALQRWMKDQS